ncbi:hypothetical protein [Kitasatospora viridis]|uniref:hypothetical protein n=1 Tax=Kitasatospora viridis TaxID=281105 RepID=UPI0014781407|nr:hypothetical protein [Kitasatospora viridis]
MTLRPQLRRRNRELATDLALAIAQLQQLALTNEQLRAVLEAASNVTNIQTEQRLI